MGSEFGLQIGQCRLHVFYDKTVDYYNSLPAITDNCDCGDCRYFANEIIKKDIRFFRILKKIGVDLNRQPNTNSDGVCSIGETNKFKKSYLGFYIAFGKIGKTQMHTALSDSSGSVMSVEYFENEVDSYIHYTISQCDFDQLKFEFF